MNNDQHSLWDGYFTQPHFLTTHYYYQSSDEAAEAQRGKATRPESQS